jgi:hypothetical protein
MEHIYELTHTIERPPEEDDDGVQIGNIFYQRKSRGSSTEGYQ